MVKLRDNKPENNGKPEERLSSLDAVRGVVLLLFISGGFGMRQMLTHERWNWLTRQWAPGSWETCTLHDLLLPAMLFLVGVGMPYSYANRQAKGQGWLWQFLHALIRASVLILIGIYLESYDRNKLVLDLRADLAQIGVAYLLAFLVLPLGMAAQGVTIGFFLIGHTAAHVIYAFAGGHDLWSPQHNLDTALDGLMRFAPESGHHVTLGIFSSAAVVLCGALIGGLIRSGIVPGVKVAIMTALAFFFIALSWVLAGGGGLIDVSWYAIIPMAKSIMTWTFVMTGVGWTLLFFTYFYLLMDGFGVTFVGAPFTIIGRNPLFVYVGYRLFHAWAERTAGLVLPTTPAVMEVLRPLLLSVLVILLFWLMCFWLYRRRIFLKV